MSNAKSLHKDPKDFTVIGKSVNRPDGIEKVIGKARFGADMNLPNQLYGKILRSPHPHAIIRKIDTSKAKALAGVKAVITAKDFSPRDNSFAIICENIMAQKKALYEGHAVAAVAAVDELTAKKALKLIKVDYKILPHVTDVMEATKKDAPVLHNDMFTEGLKRKPSKPSNIKKTLQFGHGNIEAGFADADVIVERRYTTEAAHQGYIEPHACVANYVNASQADLWCCTQGHFHVRDICSNILDMDISFQGFL